MYQRAHAVRVYNQALEIYCNKGWSIAEVRITVASAIPTVHIYICAHEG